VAESISANPQLTAEQVVALLVEPLEKASVVLAAGPRIFDSHGDPLRIPKLVSWSADPGFVAENGAIADIDATTSELVLLPSTLKSVKTMTKISNELARHSVVNIANALRDSLVRRVAGVIDQAFLTGAGTSNTVKGLVNQTGVLTGDFLTDADDTSLDWAHDAIGLQLAEEVSPNRWFMNSADFVTMRKVKDGDNRYFIQPDPTQASVYTLLGIPITVTNRLPAGTALLCDMSMVAVGRDLAPTVTLLPELFAANDQLGIRVVARYDIGLLHPEGVVVLTTPSP
jgi:HK97 family phage major capsid protein